MADIYTWYVDVVAPEEKEVIADIVDVVYPEKVQTGQDIIVKATIKNSGKDEGEIYFKLVSNPGEADEYVISSGKLLPEETRTTWQPNEELTIEFSIPPLYQEGRYKFGLKVWGETETEPQWGTAGKTVELVIR